MNLGIGMGKKEGERSLGHWVIVAGVIWAILAGQSAWAKPESATTRTRKSVADTSDVVRGQQLFQTYCTACHSFSQKGIGPNLGRVMADVPTNWIKAFIHNAPEVIAKGDARANRLFAEYGQTMPAFTNLQDADIDLLLVYIRANQAKSSLKRQGPDGIKNPIPTSIARSSRLLEVEYVSTAPASATAIPLARINKMAVLPGQPDRVFMLDLRGKLYDVTQNNWRVAFNMQTMRPNFIHTPGLATGFGSFAFHPDFYQNGLFYTTHTEKPGSAPADFAYADSIRVTLQWVITEWKITDPKAPVLSGNGREILRINMVSPIHGMQEIAFNPTARKGTPDYGMLYVGVGDGGASENGYPFLCQDKRKAWSSVWRIDPQGRNSRNGHYGIPATNPFANDRDSATVREVFCRGFRNPNRLSWSPDGKLLITDIGHANIEELNVAIPGADYGWPDREGTFVINPRGRMDQVYNLPETDATRPYVYPAAQYDHDEGKAISGGFVYSGTAIPALRGKYLFGDVNNGRVFVVDASRLAPGSLTTIEEVMVSVDGKETTFQALNNNQKPDLRIGEGLNGTLYIMTKTDGKVYRVKNLK